MKQFKNFTCSLLLLCSLPVLAMNDNSAPNIEIDEEFDATKKREEQEKKRESFIPRLTEQAMNVSTLKGMEKGFTTAAAEKTLHQYRELNRSFAHDSKEMLRAGTLEGIGLIAKNVVFDVGTNVYGVGKYVLWYCYTGLVNTIGYGPDKNLQIAQLNLTKAENILVQLIRLKNIPEKKRSELTAGLTHRYKTAILEFANSSLQYIKKNVKDDETIDKLTDELTRHYANLSRSEEQDPSCEKIGALLTEIVLIRFSDTTTKKLTDVIDEQTNPQSLEINHVDPIESKS